jgi:metal-sulfur cluster biosynthetic enzyme
MQEDLLAALNEIEDPELGIGIVDLGLVYRADWTEAGIDVEFTITAPSCPFGESFTRQVEQTLQQRFGEAASIRVKLVSEPPWTADRMTEAARRKLGFTREPIRSPEQGRQNPFPFWKQ